MPKEVTEKLIAELDAKGVKKGAKGMGDAIEKGAKKGKKAATGLDKAFGDLTTQLTTANLAAGAIQAGISLVTTSINDSIEAAKRNEQTNRNLATAMSATGQASDELHAKLNKQSARLERLTNISDEQIRSWQALAISMGAPAEKSTEFAKAAIALAKATGKSADEAIRQLTKTLGGYGGELAETLPAVKDLTAEQLRNGEVVDLINGKYGEFLGEGGKGLTGALDNVSRGFDNIGESIATASTNWDGFNDSIRTFGNILDGIALQIESGEGAELFMKVLALPVTGAVGIGTMALGGLEASKAQAWIDHAEQVADDAERLLGELSGAGKGMVLGEIDVAKVAAERARKAATRAGRWGRGELFTAAPVSATALPAGALAQPQAPDAGAQERAAQHLASRYDGLDEIMQANADRRMQLEESIYVHEQGIMDQRQQMWGEFGSSMANIGASAANTIVSSVIDMAKGEEVAFDQVAKAFLESTGQQMIGSGVQHAMQALFETANPITAPMGATRMAIAGAEIAAGAAMVGGSLAIPAEAQAGAGGAAGAGGGIATTGGGGGEVSGGRDVNIYVMGGQHPDEIAALQKRGLRESSARGF